MSKLQRYLVVCLLLVCFSVSAQVVPVSEIHPSGRIPIGTYSEYFLDSTNSLTINDFIGENSPTFSQGENDILNFGPTKNTCWVRFTYNDVDSIKQYLEVSNSNLNEIDFYVVDAGRVIRTEKAGLSRTSSNEEFQFNVFLFELPRVKNNRTLAVYLRISDARRIIVPLVITDLNSVIKVSHRRDYLFGIFFGAIIIIAFVNIFIYFYFRERLYLFYAFHIFTQILINGILQGYFLSLFGDAFYFMSPFVPGIAGLSNIFFILFAIEFLELKKHSPYLFRASRYLLALPTLNVLVNLIGFYRISADLGTYIGIIVSLWLILMGVIMYLKRVKQARFFLVGWGAFFVGILILNSALNGWIPVTPFTFNTAVFGTLIEVFLITSALADRINLLRLNHDRERVERIRLIEQQNVWLEENVRLRTNELLGKNQEIESQNEELKQQHEELSATHEVLEKQKHLVEEQNRKIENINHALEAKVQERTVELEETVKNLIRQNHDLEQFSYIVSHNMRAPVARIMGLLNLLELEDRASMDRGLIIQHLRDSALGVDQIIHDLSQIIRIRKGTDSNIELIDLVHVLQHNLSDLEDEIKNAGATIIKDLKVKEMLSVKSYVQSILYNLISNAIKYRNPERPSIIHVTIAERDGRIVFEVLDNGLGIALPKERISEVFHLYKRLHNHVQGKGLGLFLVKTQVDQLQGTIEVDTEAGKGTRFTVYLPKN